MFFPRKATIDYFRPDSDSVFLVEIEQYRLQQLVDSWNKLARLENAVERALEDHSIPTLKSLVDPKGILDELNKDFDVCPPVYGIPPPPSVHDEMVKDAWQISITDLEDIITSHEHKQH